MPQLKRKLRQRRERRGTNPPNTPSMPRAKPAAVIVGTQGASLPCPQHGVPGQRAAQPNIETAMQQQRTAPLPNTPQRHTIQLTQAQ
eukprot:9402318-Pyramimonas_sp.AAC.1